MTATTAAYQESLALARANGDPARISNALYNLSFLAVWGATDEDASRSGRRSSTPSSKRRWPWPGRSAIGPPSPAACGRWETPWPTCARTTRLRWGRCAEAIPIFREIGDPFGLAWALHGEGIARLRIGDLAAARAAFDEQVALLGDARDPSGLAIALGNQAQLAVAEGDQLRAARLAGASAALRHLTGAELVSKVDEVEGRVIEASPEDDGAWKEGLAMTFDQAVAFALRRPAP